MMSQAVSMDQMVAVGQNSAVEPWLDTKELHNFGSRRRLHTGPLRRQEHLVVVENPGIGCMKIAESNYDHYTRFEMNDYDHRHSLLEQLLLSRR